MNKEVEEAKEHFKILNELCFKTNYKLDLQYTESEVDNSNILLNYIKKLEDGNN